MQKNNLKNGAMGEKPLLGEDVKKRLCKHIKKLQNSGFVPTKTAVKILA